jgi:hypothetical protein
VLPQSIPKRKARLRTNITIRLQRNPKAQRMPPQNYAADFSWVPLSVNATARAEQ